MNKKNILIALFAFILVVALILWLSNRNINKGEVKINSFPDSQEKITIITSLFPWYDLARQIGGDKVEVSLLLPPGVEPHAFEPTPSDMINISRADLFIYTGDYMEPWAGDILNSLGADTPQSLALGSGLASIAHKYEDEEINDHNQEDLNHINARLDPHIWLDPSLVTIAADRLTEILSEIDQKNSIYYQQNLKNYQSRLEQLDLDYQVALAKCAQRDFIYAGHYAFGYLAARYNLQYQAAQGFTPDAESSPQSLSILLKTLKNNGAEYVFAAELDNPQLAKSLAEDAGVDIILLNSANNVSRDDLEAGISYEQIMRENLDKLILGLRCQ